MIAEPSVYHKTALLYHLPYYYRHHQHRRRYINYYLISSRFHAQLYSQISMYVNIFFYSRTVWAMRTNATSMMTNQANGLMRTKSASTLMVCWRLFQTGTESSDFYHIKDGGLIREFSSYFKPTFHPCTVFRQPCPLPEDALGCRWPTEDCIVYYRTGGVRGDNCIVCNFYSPAAIWTVHAKKIDR